MEKKFFNVHNSQDIVTVINDKDTFYELSDGNMIKKDSFMQKYQPVLEDYMSSDIPSTPSTPSTPLTFTQSTQNDVLNPENFFNISSISPNIVESIKNSDISKAPINDINRTQVVNKSLNQNVQNNNNNTSLYGESLVTEIPDGEQVIPNHTNTDVSQYKVHENEDDAYNDIFKGKNQVQQTSQSKQKDNEKEKMRIEYLFDDEKLALGEEEAILRRNKRLHKLPTEEVSTQKSTLDAQNIQVDGQVSMSPITKSQQISPIDMMFSTFKRKHEIEINVKFEDKIGDPNFIKMMVENMDGDIVGYYKNIIMKNIMNNLSNIEEAVEDKIHFEIYGKKMERTVIGKETKLIDDLIPGGKTASGKQKYKYIDDKGEIKELIPSTAKKKGLKPFKEEN